MDCDDEWCILATNSGPVLYLTSYKVFNHPFLSYKIIKKKIIPEIPWDAKLSSINILFNIGKSYRSIHLVIHFFFLGRDLKDIYAKEMLLDACYKLMCVTSS